MSLLFKEMLEKSLSLISHKRAPYFLSFILFSVANLIIIKYLGEVNDARTVYFFINAQYVANAVSILIFYGVYFEGEIEFTTLDTKYFIYFIAAISLFFPEVSLILLLVLRAAQVKFSRPGLVDYKVVLVFLILYAFIVHDMENIYLYIVNGVLSYFAYSIWRQSSILVPTSVHFSFAYLLNLFKRVTPDYLLIAPPIILNIITFEELSPIYYIDFQKCMVALASAAVMSGLVERLILDDIFRDNKEAASSNNNFLIYSIIISMTLATLVALFLDVFFKFFTPLLLSSAISSVFAFKLTKLRQELSSVSFFIMGIVWVFIFALILYYIFSGNLQQRIDVILLSLVAFTFLKIIIMYCFGLFRKKAIKTG